MKLSFSIAGKSSSKQQANLKSSQKFNGEAQDQSANADKEYVTVFDPSKPTQKSKKLVIPPKQNEWRPLKKMKNLEIPLAASADQDLRFEVETAVAADGGPNISYGLNLRNSDEAVKTEPEERPSRPAPVETVMLQKLKDDLMKLPDGPGLEDYAEMPIEGFGAALLAGYGWQEGMGIGRNAKKDVKIAEYKKWVGKEGLGFFSEPPSNNSNGSGTIKKDKEKDKEKEQRTSRGEEGQFSVGKDFRIVGGKYIGLKGRIVDAENGSDTVVLRLSRSDEEVGIKIRDLAELGSVEEERCLKKLKELKIGDSSSKAQNRRSDGNRSKDSRSRQSFRESKGEDSRVDDNRKESKRNKEEGKRTEQREDRRVSWLTSHIRVRIISKDLKKGRLYLKKGEIVDVVGPTTCDITMDDSRELIQGVAQDLLETALPPTGGPVLVLYGKHKGVYGNLMEKKRNNETGIVRDADSHELLSVRLEQIAEYIGDPSYLGY